MGIVAVNIGDQPGVSPREAIMVIEMGSTTAMRPMREVWHGSVADAHALRDALDALLPASKEADPRLTPKPRKTKTPRPSSGS